MVDFSNIRRRGKPVPTVDVTFYGMGADDAEPVITFKPANQDNAPYFNEWMRRMRQGRANRSQDVKVEDLDRNRRVDVDLLPKYCATKWRNVVDANGPVDFSIGNCQAFLQRVVAINWQAFDDVKAHIADPANFFDYDDPGDVEAQAKN